MPIEAPEIEAIENHAIIGDLHTIALVALNGSIDFMCFPRFDSPSVFAALLDRERGGHFTIAPELNGAERKQLYLPDSNILLTRFLSSSGVIEISDFMPVEAAGSVSHNLVRRVKCVRGEARVKMICAPSFNYARSTHIIERASNDVIFISEGPDQCKLRLRSSIPLEIKDGAAVAAFALRPDQHVSFVLEDASENLACDPDGYVAESFKNTLNFWRNWIGRSQYRGRWREAVNRSALTLKLLVSEPHGSLVAAPTFGLPEVIGGVRNWDYRYTWIRDASFTIYALMRLGYTSEAAAFNHWIEQRCGELNQDGSLQIMYGIDGRHDLTEESLDLAGYCGSRPVRIGNAAWNQLQLDIHGELMDSVYLYDKWGEPIGHDLWVNLVRLVDWVCANWHRPDEGIWEVRGGRQEFLYSRVMCWVAIDRAIRIARRRSFPAPLPRWADTRDAIYHDVFTSFWDKEKQTFVQHKGSKTVDASCLLMPLVKFISPVDRRWLSTLKAVERELVEDSLVHRYRIGRAAPDGLPGQEGTFCMCTFWYAECLARSGDPQQGRFIFEKMLGYANHATLYAEELGPAGEHLGNFPQAFTHLGLISAAHALDRALEAGGHSG